MLQITHLITIASSEIDISAVRSQGAGGQNINKVASAIHLRFDIRASSLPDRYKTQLLQRDDRRITAAGIIVIKAQRYRSQDKNREDALQRLKDLISSAGRVPVKRIPTKPTTGSQERRLASKTRQGLIKAARSKVTE